MNKRFALPAAALLLLSACGSTGGTAAGVADLATATISGPSVTAATRTVTPSVAAATAVAPSLVPSAPVPASPSLSTAPIPVATVAAGATTTPLTQPTPAPATPAPATPAPATPAPVTPPPAASRSVAVTLTDSSITLGQSSAPGGAITFKITNTGFVAHELVVLQTSIPQDQLPPDPSNPKIVQQPGYVGMAGNIAANTSATLTLTLPAGPYVLICNMPNHYKDGMHIGFTVTAP
jgi:uncharacterized cupredoxin-like copper-binding protein